MAAFTRTLGWCTNRSTGSLRPKTHTSASSALADGQPHPHVAYGVFLDKQGRFAQYLPMLKRPLERNPQSFDTRFGLGKALLHVGQLEQAAEMLERGSREAIRQLC